MRLHGADGSSPEPDEPNDVEECRGDDSRGPRRGKPKGGGETWRGKGVGVYAPTPKAFPPHDSAAPLEDGGATRTDDQKELDEWNGNAKGGGWASTLGACRLAGVMASNLANRRQKRNYRVQTFVRRSHGSRVAWRPAARGQGSEACQ
jgi:hypothetical protein